MNNNSYNNAMSGNNSSGTTNDLDQNNFQALSGYGLMGFPHLQHQPPQPPPQQFMMWPNFHGYNNTSNLQPTFYSSQPPSQSSNTEFPSSSWNQDSSHHYIQHTGFDPISQQHQQQQQIGSNVPPPWMIMNEWGGGSVYNDQAFAMFSEDAILSSLSIPSSSTISEDSHSTKHLHDDKSSILNSLLTSTSTVSSANTLTSSPSMSSNNSNGNCNMTTTITASNQAPCPEKSTRNDIRKLHIQLRASLRLLEMEKQKISKINLKDTHYIVADQALEETIAHVKKLLNIVNKKQTKEEKECTKLNKQPNHTESTEQSNTLENYYNMRKFSENIYGFFPKHLVSKVRYDSELALSYLTPFNDAFEIASIMNEMIKQQTGFYPNHIIDGTGGLGGNVIGFLRYFWSKRLHRKTVTMIELDERRCKDAQYNINLFENEEKKYDKDCVTCHVECGNFIDWWNKEKPKMPETKRSETLIFFDPPWGNADYSLHEFIDDLYMIQENLSPVSVKAFSQQLLLEDGVHCVVLKVPYNFSEHSLSETLKVEYILMKKVKYVLLFRKENK
ncbi:hypothetical protein C9374_012179 [Naegleria lovaniensis]|uniref:Trimethylguanosine synthase n=1 Tax=Naegleria lovaniensis TaxID=51637 RepID=A0AA88GBT8_NAELO|nr:uncharacterized protein C9374_013086 [Naegleria lovaniensis]XP_044542614.1 uncharacterized protein C9374_012179 [Naegleria lovaniensis]KAG2372879.1 hypothetical protein C9374_013086 [Naegleria lovaniensis]KAG2373440.1 hypothetical protein C9374_012179 [Naegleria lovaniensis]